MTLNGSVVMPIVHRLYVEDSRRLLAPSFGQIPATSPFPIARRSCYPCLTMTTAHTYTVPTHRRSRAACPRPRSGSGNPGVAGGVYPEPRPKGSIPDRASTHNALLSLGADREPSLSLPVQNGKSDSFPIFLIFWAPFSLAALYIMLKQSPSQAQHNSTVNRHFTPKNPFLRQKTPFLATFGKWLTIIQRSQPA